MLHKSELLVYNQLMKKAKEVGTTSLEQNKKPAKYIPHDIELKWREKWVAEKLYEFKEDATKEKYYNLVEFPYPSGDLHLGHWFAFVPPDVHARYKRMLGYNVFFPNGFDAFGLPAENAAIKRGIHPQDWTMSNIATMTKQFETMGTIIDWSHKVISCLPQYYRWNQWIFIQMFKKGLAYRGKAFSNWCPSCQTVLANEGIESGKCWRCGTEVVQKEIEQWFLKITDYADKLLWDNTDKPLSNGVDWPKSVREGQNNWIGRSTGTAIFFQVDGSTEKIKVFTTRADTLYGGTFLVLAPEHPFVSVILNSVQDPKIPKQVRDDIVRYVEKTSKKTELERKEMKEKTGVFTGAYVLNPLSNEKMPVWIADYALIGYGTGALFGDAHDERDTEFANKYDIALKPTIVTGDKKRDEAILSLKELYLGYGTLVNSGEFSGLSSKEAMIKVTEWLEKKGQGEAYVVYHLHDWSISRQRYWGTPVPMIDCPKCGIVPVPEKDLPVEIPYEVDYTPKGKPPLASNEAWMKVACPKCGGDAQRDPETLDTFFDSSWYFFRYTDPKYNKAPFDTELAKKLMPVDIYFGGSEHTLGHTLYARFFTKFFKDLGLTNIDEFANKRVQHGIVLGPDGNRMSKSKGNVVNPDDVVKEYGTDTVRLYLCFMMPYEATAPWDKGAIAGIYRFLRRVWDLKEKIQNSESRVQNSPEDLHIMHKTIQKVGEDVSSIKFNTAVAAMMQWLNHLGRKEQISEEEFKTFLLLLSPFAPHFTEELWQQIKGDRGDTRAKGDKGDAFDSIHNQAWPQVEARYLSQDVATIVVQVNGKLRDNLQVESADSTVQAVVEKQAKESEKVKKYLEGKEIKKVIFVPGKIINFVTG